MPFQRKFFKTIEDIMQKCSFDSNSIKSIFSSDAQDLIATHQLADIKHTKGAKEIFYNFFGMNEHWKTGRNILGMVMVHSPEYPTYFIPAFTQTKETGNSGHIKEGEGIRGLITGGLEGIAVGALVSGAKLKPKEMIPYVILGAGLQYLSGKLFPWLGEKAGLYLYNKKIKQNPDLAQGVKPIDTEKSNEQPLSKTSTIKTPNPQFKGRSLYGNFNSGSLKI
ncbi:MAG: hypothetical protein WCG95_07645 [bacterium]